MSVKESVYHVADAAGRDKRIREHHVCISRLADGRTAVTVAASTCVGRIKRAFRWSPTVRSSQWYVTKDPWFNRFPRCRTPKLFPIDPAALQLHLDSAEPLR